MSSISHTVGNIGLDRIYIIPEVDITSAPYHLPGQDYLQGTFTLASGKAWDEIYFVKASGKFNEDTIVQGGDDIYQTNIEFKTAKAQPVTATTIKNLKNKKVCCVYRDRNGFFKVVRKVVCKISEDSGRIGGGFNGYLFRLNGRNISKSGYLTGFNGEVSAPGEGTINPIDLTHELIDDRVSDLLQNNDGIVWTYNDEAGTITPSLTGTANRVPYFDGNGDIVTDDKLRYNPISGMFKVEGYINQEGTPENTFSAYFEDGIKIGTTTNGHYFFNGNAIITDKPFVTESQVTLTTDTPASEMAYRWRNMDGSLYLDTVLGGATQENIFRVEANQTWIFNSNGEIAIEIEADGDLKLYAHDDLVLDLGSAYPNFIYGFKVAGCLIYQAGDYLKFRNNNTNYLELDVENQGALFLNQYNTGTFINNSPSYFTGFDGDGKLVQIDILSSDGSKITMPKLILSSLPTSDPGVTGELWNDSGTVKISA